MSTLWLKIRNTFIYCMLACFLLVSVARVNHIIRYGKLANGMVDSVFVLNLPDGDGGVYQYYYCTIHGQKDSVACTQQTQKGARVNYLICPALEPKVIEGNNSMPQWLWQAASDDIIVGLLAVSGIAYWAFRRRITALLTIGLRKLFPKLAAEGEEEV